MDEQQEILEEEGAEQSVSVRTWDVLLRILITQAVCVGILLAGVMAVRFISPKTFAAIRTWYADRFLVETSVDEVLGAAEEDHSDIPAQPGQEGTSDYNGQPDGEESHAD